MVGDADRTAQTPAGAPFGPVPDGTRLGPTLDAAPLGQTPGGNQSVARAVLVLDALAEARGDMELGVTELSDVTGLAKSVVSRVLVPLVAGGYVEQNPRTRRYRVGVRMFELGLRYLRHSGAREAALILLDELARETGATSYLGVLDGAHCVVLAAIEGSDRLRVVVTAGERTPVHVTAMGKAIMAALDDESLERLLGSASHPRADRLQQPSTEDGPKGTLAAARPHQPQAPARVSRTPATDRSRQPGDAARLSQPDRPTAADKWHTLSPDELRHDIMLARQRGYAVTQRDGYPGVWSVGAVLPVQGETLMSVSVDLPAYSATEEQLHTVGRLLAARTSRFVESMLPGGTGRFTDTAADNRQRIMPGMLF